MVNQKTIDLWDNNDLTDYHNIYLPINKEFKMIGGE